MSALWGKLSQIQISFLAMPITQIPRFGAEACNLSLIVLPPKVRAARTHAWLIGPIGSQVVEIQDHSSAEAARESLRRAPAPT